MKTKLSFLIILFSVKVLAQIPTTNLDSEYKFTNTILDTYGTAQDLTQTGSASTFTTDRFGETSNAINLAGDYFKRSALFSNDLSVSFWVKTSTNNANKLTIIDQSNRTSNTEDNTKTGWYIYLQNGKIGMATNFSWSYYNSGTFTGTSGYANTIATTSVSDNNWHHVVVIFQKAPISSSIGGKNLKYNYKIYIDNILSISNSTTSQITLASSQVNWNITSSATSITIANDHLNNLTNRYTGTIDDIRLYTTTLTATDVSILFNEANSLNTEDFDNFSNFTVFPNPSNSLITVSSIEDIEFLEIISIEGRRIKSVSGSIIDITDLSNGIYLLQVKTNEGKTGIKRIIKN